MTLIEREVARRSPDGSRLVDAIAYAAIAFLYDRETGRSVERVLARLGQALEVDHVALVPLDPAGQARAWHAVEPRDFQPAASRLPEAGAWFKHLAQGSVVAANQGRGRMADPAALDGWGAQSLLMAPVFLNGVWWGVLAAVDGHRARRWSRHHHKAMLAVAGTLGAALRTELADSSLRESRQWLRQAQHRANAYRRRLDELILASRDAILVIEPDGFVSRWNAVAGSLFGFASGHRPGRDYRDFLPFHLRRELTPMIDAARQGQATHARSFDFPKGEACRYLLVSTFPLGDPAGTVALVACDQTEAVTVRDRLENSLAATIEALAAAMEARDPYTAGHQRRTADMAEAIARVMGLPEDDIRGIRTAAVIHDIGKICVPAEILTCPRRLNEAEMALIRMHPKAGHDIVRSIAFPWPVATMILQHHERLDGRGYPSGIAGDRILMGARIIGVADMVEAVTNHRPYRPALGIEAARTELLAGRGTAYDPRVVDACLAVMDEQAAPAP